MGGALLTAQAADEPHPSTMTWHATRRKRIAPYSLEESR